MNKTGLLILLLLLSMSCKKHSIRKSLERGNQEYMVQKYGGAIAFYDLVLEKEPVNKSALMNKALAFSKMGDHENALINLDILLSQDSNHEKAFYQKAMCLFELKRYKESIPYFTRLQDAKHFDKNEILFYRAMANFHEKSYIPALHDLDGISNESAYQINALYWKGIVYENLNDWHSAVAQYKKLVNDGEQDELTYFRLGWCNLNLNENFYAKYYYSSSLQINPNLKLAYLHRGLAHFRLKQYNEAIADYTDYLELDSANQAPALIGRALSNLMIGQVNKSANDLFLLDESQAYDLLVKNLINSLSSYKTDTLKDANIFKYLQDFETNNPF